MQKDTLSKNIQEQSFGGTCRRGKMGGSSRVRVKSIGFVGQTGCGSIGSRVELTRIFQTNFFFF